MNLKELLTNEELRRHEFPVTRERIFFAHAGVCALPRRVTEAITEYVRQAGSDNQESVVFPALLTKGRALAAKLLGCAPGEIAFVGPTSLALSFFASGIKLRRGDNILVHFDDYPSNVYPWMALASQGVEVRLMNTRGLGVIRPRDVMGQVDENTRLVALASSHFVSGYRIDHAAIGKYLRERGILFCVDGIQTVGAMPTTVEHVDMLAADSHKWMLGPSGAGLMYVRREAQPQVNPPIYGAHNVKCPDFVAQEQIVLRDDARKYEAGTHNLPGLVGMVAAMELIMEIGVDAIAHELLRKRAWLIPELQAKGYVVLNADAPQETGSGITTFSHPDRDMNALHEKLTQAKVVAHLRVDRGGKRYIRVSPHFYNTDAELEKMLGLL